MAKKTVRWANDVASVEIKNSFDHQRYKWRSKDYLGTDGMQQYTPKIKGNNWYVSADVLDCSQDL